MQKCVVRNRGKGTVNARGNEVTLNLAKIASRKVECIIKRCMGHLYSVQFGYCTWLLEKQLERFSVQGSQSKCCICIHL